MRTPLFSCRIEFKGDPQLNDPEAKLNLFFKINSSEFILQRYTAGISILPLDAVAKTVEITCKDANRGLARDIVQALAESFILYDVERKGQSAESINVRHSYVPKRTPCSRSCVNRNIGCNISAWTMRWPT